MLLTIKNDKLTVSVDTHGAELKSIKSKSGTEYLWQAEKSVWGSSAPILFPICGRLANGQYTLNGKTYALPCHGFASKSEFIGKADDNTLVFTLNANDETKTAYPFDFSLVVTYTLNGNRLICSTEVLNVGENEMPFGIGAHPGFNIPVQGDTFEDYYLDFGEGYGDTLNVMVLNKVFFSDKRKNVGLKDRRYLPLDRSLFNTDGMFILNPPKTVSLYDKKGDFQLSMETTDAKYLGFWQANKPGADYLAIEPWQSSPDWSEESENIMEKKDMVHLRPQEQYRFEYVLQFGK